MRARHRLLALAVCALSVAAAAVPETFTATASATTELVSASVPFSVTITRYASAGERELVLEAVRTGGTAVRTALAGLDDAGFIQLGERRTPIKFAGERPTGSGRLVTVVAAEPLLFIRAGTTTPRRQTGAEVTVAMLVVQNAGDGLGELAPAATVGVDHNGALLIEDYGSTVVWLKGLVRAK
jgi:hypothetical protein